MKRNTKITIALVIVLIIATVATVAFAGKVWEHKWDAKTIIVDRYDDGARFHAYGYDTYLAWPGGEILFYKNFGCYDAGEGERVRVYAKGDGSVSVEGGCAIMTPTPAPTQRP